MAIFENKSEELIIEHPDAPCNPLYWAIKVHEQTNDDPEVDSAIMLASTPLHASAYPSDLGMYWKVDQEGENYTIRFKGTPGDGWADILLDTGNIVQFKDNEHAANITAVRVESWCLNSYADITSMFAELSNLEGVVDLSKMAVYNSTQGAPFTMMNAFKNCSKLEQVKFGEYIGNDISLMTYAFSGCTALTSVDFGDCNIASGTAQELFKNCTSLRTVTSLKGTITDATSMFYNCTALTTLDLSKCNFKGIMSGTFLDCTSLSSITFGSSSPTQMLTVFGGTVITELDLSKFDVSHCVTFMGMCAGCTSLTKVNLSGWNLSSATMMANMFSGDTALAELDVSGWTLSLSGPQVADMFAQCTALKTIKMDKCNVQTIKNFLGFRYITEEGTSALYGYLPYDETATYATNYIEHLSLKGCTIDVTEQIYATETKTTPARNLLTGSVNLVDIDLTNAVIKAGPEGITGEAEFDLTYNVSLEEDSHIAVANQLLEPSTLHITLPKVIVATVYTTAQTIAENKHWQWATA